MSEEKENKIEEQENKAEEQEEKQEGTLFVPAAEITKYLSDLSNVLTLIVKGIGDSKNALVKKSEAKGEATNDSNKD